MLKRLFIILMINGVCSFISYSQKIDNTSIKERKWYGGVQGGPLFGVSTFSSFGADKTHVGWDAGAFAGYRFTPALSLEVQTAFSKMSLTVQDCCLDRNYWYGADGVRYNAPVFGMEGVAYGDLKSKVFMQRYGVQLNINLLGFFSRTMYGRWSVDLSPALSTVGTKADIQNNKSGQTLNKENTKWHVGLGGNLQVGYRVADRVQLGVYSGLTYLTGSRLDGMPKYLHKNNYTWGSGIRLGFVFGKKGKKPASANPVPVVGQESVVKKEEPVTKEEAVIKEQPSRIEAKDSIAEARKDVAEIVETSRHELVFPVIRFSFNSVWIESSERGKVAQIARLLKEHPEVNIRIKGYADGKGSDAVNHRVSEARAKVIKDWLVKKFNIDASRISAIGAGVDKNKSAEEARRAETDTKVNE